MEADTDDGPVHDVQHEGADDGVPVDEDRGGLAVQHRSGAQLTPCSFLATLRQELELRWWADDGLHRRTHLAAAVGPDNHVVRQHGEEARKIAGGAGHQETVGQGAALAQIGIEALAPLLNTRTGTATSLSARCRRPAQGAGHLLAKEELKMSCSR